MHVVILPVPLHSHTQYHNASTYYYGKSFGFSATKAPEYQLGKSYLGFCVAWLETCHHLDRERISVLSEILLETIVMRDFKCSSVKRDPKGSQQRKIFFWEAEIKDLQLCFRALLAKLVITLLINYALL